MEVALTIAGSDPSGGAGIQSDIRVFQRFGIHGLSIPCVLTAQGTEGVSEIFKIPADFVEKQIRVLLNDMIPDATKTGMLYSSEIIRVVSEVLSDYDLKNIVVDPVMVSSTGVSLLEKDAMTAMREYLFPIASVITPNIREASVIADMNIEDTEDMKRAAERIIRSGIRAVIITGGHLKDKKFDLLFDGQEMVIYEKEHIVYEVHGTGCVFSASITACLARGDNLKDAFRRAVRYTELTIKASISPGKGLRIPDLNQSIP